MMAKRKSLPCWESNQSVCQTDVTCKILNALSNSNFTDMMNFKHVYQNECSLTGERMNNIFHLHSALLSHTEDQAVTEQKVTLSSQAPDIYGLRQY
jgi:hypothetical protein